MYPSIINIPAEINLSIIEELKTNGSPNDLINLGYTCHFFRDLLIPFHFSSVVLSNNEASAANIRAIVEAGYAHHVKELHYKGKHVIPDCDYEELAEDDQLDEDEMANLLPSSVADILGDLSLLPDLRGLVVEFPFGNGDGEDDAEWIGSFYNFDDEESGGEVLERERVYGWRALMKKSWDAIVLNMGSDHGIRFLELRETVAKGVSTWDTQAFRAFLEPIEEFKISVRGNDNGAGWCINTLDGYHFFLQNLGTYFFNHLPNVTTLSLHASDSGPIGLEGTRHSPTPFTPISLSNLRVLNLEYVFIDPPLIEFLATHAQTLERISLHNCMAGLTGLAENGITWSHLFTSLTAANPPNLKCIEILPVEVEGVGNLDSDQDGDPEYAKQATEMMEGGGTMRAFPYKILDDKYGMLFNDEESSLRGFIEGGDLTGWGGLEEVVVRNRGAVV